MCLHSTQLISIVLPAGSIIIWLLHNLVEASFDLFRYLLLGDQLKPWELHPLVSYTSCMNLNLLCHNNSMPQHYDRRRSWLKGAVLERQVIMYRHCASWLYRRILHQCRTSSNKYRASGRRRPSYSTVVSEVIESKQCAGFGSDKFCGNAEYLQRLAFILT